MPKTALDARKKRPNMDWGMTMIYNQIKHVLSVFQLSGRYSDVQELHSGNINNTYHLQYKEGNKVHNYTLQRVNGYVFKRPDVVTENIRLVTDHVKRSLIDDGIDPDRRVLELIPTRRGELIYQDEMGSYWRVYRFIENATAYDVVEKPEHFYEAGRGFGEFQRRLIDFPASEIVDTIPDFHNTTRRFCTFVESLTLDRAGRVADLEEEIEFFFERRRMMSEIVKRLKLGELPLRVTHNDTKINNVMIDNETEKALCIIDLDTVMAGSALYDYGDAIRYGASTAIEDEPDVSKIALDMEKFKAFTRGFVEETNGFLTQKELKLLPLGVKVITCELAMRFLTDYMDGDLYFKVRSPYHNLIRTHAQMKLLQDIEAKYYEMQAFIDGLIEGN